MNRNICGYPIWGWGVFCWMIWSMLEKGGWFGFLMHIVLLFVATGIGFLLCWAVNQQEWERFQEWIRK